MGRPKGSSPLLNDDRTKAICALLEEGVAEKHAAEACGIAENTYHGWIAKGAEGVEPYAKFREAVTCARARGAIFLHRKAVAGGKGSMGAQFVLERRFRDEYGPRQRIEHSGPDGKEIQIAAKAVTDMSDEELLKLANPARSTSGTGTKGTLPP